MFDFTDAMGATPLESRSNPLLYTFILIAAVVLFVLLIFYIVQRYIKNLHSSQKWIEANKEKETTLKNINVFAKEAALDQNETKLLWQICHEAHFKNILYSYTETEEVDELFKNAYQKLDSQDNQENIKILFEIRYKIEKLHNKRTLLTTTRSLPEGQAFTYVDKTGFPWELTLLKNDEKQIILKVPPTLMIRGNQPASLEKITLNFTTAQGISYSLFTRVVRYEKKNESDINMVLASTNSIKSAQRRGSKRMNTQLNVKFFAVKPVKKGKKTVYEGAEKRYPGKMEDLSATGCRLDCALPIKQGQNIGIEFSIDGSQEFNAIGTIVATKKSKDEKYYVLHIKFENIDLKAKKRINAKIYNYTIEL